MRPTIDNLKAKEQKAPAPKTTQADSTEERRQRLRKLLHDQRQADRKVQKKLWVTIALISILALGLVVAGGVLYARNQYLATPEGIAAGQEKQADRIVKKAAQLLELPDEKPLVSLISDINKLSSQKFFQEAANGDVVLIFENSRRAVIYRESENRIINDGPLVSGVE